MYRPAPVLRDVHEESELTRLIEQQAARIPSHYFLVGALGAMAASIAFEVAGNERMSRFVGMWALNKLPQPYHPVFNVAAFARASMDRFFLCIASGDPKFDRAGTQQFLESLHPVGVSEVAP